MVIRSIWRRISRRLSVANAYGKCFFMSIVSLAASFVRVPEIVVSKSYAPEKKRKSFFSRLYDNLWWAIKYKEPNVFYNLYLQDSKDYGSVKNSSIKDYRSFYYERQTINKIIGSEYSYVAMLRDKYLMSILMEHNDIPTVHNLFLIRDGFITDDKGKATTLENVFSADSVDYFIKRVDGECADSVFHVTRYEDIKPIDLSNGKYVVQPRLIQNTRMNELWDGCINTCRVVTTYYKGNVKVLSAVLRVGTKASGHVDNWAKGGLSVGIKSNGELEKYGLYKPVYGGRVNKHPDTGIAFSNFAIPDYPSVIDICKRAHMVFSDIPAIGWDVAITDQGPVIIEGNDNWEISLMQASNHGLKKEWDSFFSLYNSKIEDTE